MTKDGEEALTAPLDGGIEPAMIEIVAKDGTVFRIYGDKAMPAPSQASAESGVTKEWQQEIEKLKAKAPGPKGR